MVSERHLDTELPLLNGLGQVWRSLLAALFALGTIAMVVISAIFAAFVVVFLTMLGVLSVAVLWLKSKFAGRRPAASREQSNGKSDGNTVLEAQKTVKGWTVDTH